MDQLKESTGGADRIVALDFVRGVAILGILLLNIVGFAWPEIVSVSPRAPTAPVSTADDWTYLALLVFADGKFRGLFSLLFGASLLLFVDRADAARQRLGGRDGPALQRRRLGWLGLFGLAHFFLLWRGDILFLYAMCGLVALALRQRTPHKLVSLALAIYAAGVLGLGGLTALAAFDPANGAEIVADYAREARTEIAVAQSPWAAHVWHNLREDWSAPLITLPASCLETVPLMLIGMALFKSGMFGPGQSGGGQSGGGQSGGGPSGGGWDAARLRRWAGLGIACNLALMVPLAGLLWAQDFALPLTLFVWLAPAALGRLAGTIGYAALAVLLARRFAANAWGERLVACGRMAFSNYIATSLVMTFIFHGWGLGLYASVGRFELLGFVLLGWALMLGWSKPWLARFRFGPLEWAWRSLTYGQTAPFRRPLAIAIDSQ